jgi:hypothetical protein
MEIKSDQFLTDLLKQQIWGLFSAKIKELRVTFFMLKFSEVLYVQSGEAWSATEKRVVHLLDNKPLNEIVKRKDAWYCEDCESECRYEHCSECGNDAEPFSMYEIDFEKLKKEGECYGN